MLSDALSLAVDVLLAMSSAADSITAARAVFDAEDVLAKTSAAYAAHTSYADSRMGLDEATRRGGISRRTTTIKHQANPRLEPTQFRFAVPAS